MAKKMDKDLMHAAAKKLYGARCPNADDVTDTQLANALRKAFKKYAEEHGKTSLSQCSECEEFSPSDEAQYPACPFCGEGGMVETTQSTKKEEAVGDKKDEKQMELGGVSKSNGAAAKPKVAKEKKAAKPKAAKEAKPAKAPKAAKEKKAAKPKAAKAEIVPKLTDAQKAKLRDSLDVSVKSIRDLQRDGQKAAYDIGRELEKVFTSHSWKARGKFKSFKEWCNQEMGFTTSWVRACIQVTKEFDRETFVKIGPAKLAVIKALPAEERKPVLKMAEEGADIRDIQKKVTKVREHMRERDGGKRTGRPPSAAVSSVVKFSGKAVELVLFARDLGKDNKPVVLDSAEPGCWTSLDLGGGTSIRIELVVAKGGKVTGLSAKALRAEVPAPAPTATN